MRKILKKSKKIFFLLFIPSILITIGLIFLYFSSEDKIRFQKQIFFVFLSFLFFFLFAFSDYRFFKNNPYFLLLLYVFSLLLLGGLFFFAPQIKGTRSWYKIGNFSFDPIGFAKIVLILILAKYFSLRHVEMYRLRHILISGIYVFFPAFLISCQPNLGSALFLIILWLGILFLSGIKIRHFLVLLFFFFLILCLFWFFWLKEYQKARIIAFFYPKREPLGAGWQQLESKIAIGAGGLIGQGIGKGTQSRYGFLPEFQTDFIFAAIAEQIGFFGTSLILFLYLILFWQIIKIALFAKDNFGRLFALGFLISIFSETFVNISMNLGILPVIGISLPFLSYGGSNLIMNMIGLGILENIYLKNT